MRRNGIYQDVKRSSPSASVPQPSHEGTRILVDEFRALGARRDTRRARDIQFEGELMCNSVQVIR